MMRALLRPGQFPLPNIAVKAPPRPYESLREMQVWTGGRHDEVFLAHWTGRHWFLLHRFWPGSAEYLVNPDGSLWVYGDRAYDRPSGSTLEDLSPTGGIGTRCGPCGCVSLPGENRHTRDCPFHPLMR